MNTMFLTNTKFDKLPLELCKTICNYNVESYGFMNELKNVCKYLFTENGKYDINYADNILNHTQRQISIDMDSWRLNNEDEITEPIEVYEQVDYSCKFCGWREENPESHIQCGNFGCWYLHHKFIMDCDDGDMFIVKKKPDISRLFLYGKYEKVSLSNLLKRDFFSDSESEESDSD